MAATAESPRKATSAATEHRALFFDQFPYGLMLADADGRILELNAQSAELLAIDEATRRAPATCCEIVCGRALQPVEHGCLTRRALDSNTDPPEIEIELAGSEGPESAWLTALAVGAGAVRVLFHLRPVVAVSDEAGKARDRQPPPELRVHALGHLRVESEGVEIEGEWLRRRPGELFKYMLCERARTLPSEQIAEALWTNAGQSEALTSVRHYVHQLRKVLQPDRDGSTPSHVLTRRGGYALAYGWLDADEFERSVERGLQMLTLGGRDAEARTELVEARALYRGDFLADDPYAEWALAERDRLRELASLALRALISLDLDAGRLEQAADHARDLADLDPFDVDVHREYLGICLRLGRRSEAMRRYALLCDRLRRSFGEEPDFTLRDLTAEACGRSERPASLAGV